MEETIKWISVDEELPPALKDVIIYTKTGSIIFAYKCGGPKSEFVTCDPEDYYFNVTHWAHLPKGPKTNE